MPQSKPPLEDTECEWLVQWMTMRGLKFAHIANENKATSRKSAAILGAKRKRMGVSPGVPDYMIVLPPRRLCADADGKEVFTRRILFIEMKRQRSVPSDVSPEQREWIATLNATLPGVRAIVCRGFDEAREQIEREMAT